MTNPNEGVVVVFTNISDKDFTHPYSGTPYFVPAGETVQFPYHIGMHLAKHLARKMLLANDKGATQYDAADKTSANGNGTVIWNEESEKNLVEQIIGKRFTHEVSRPKSDDEKMREQIAELNKFKDDFLAKNNMVKPVVTATPVVAPITENPSASADGFMDKGQLIEALKKLGIPVDARKSKAALETMLKEAQTVTA